MKKTAFLCLTIIFLPCLTLYGQNKQFRIGNDQLIIQVDTNYSYIVDMLFSSPIDLANNRDNTLDKYEIIIGDPEISYRIEDYYHQAGASPYSGIQYYSSLSRLESALKNNAQTRYKVITSKSFWYKTSALKCGYKVSRQLKVRINDKLVFTENITTAMKNYSGNEKPNTLSGDIKEPNRSWVNSSFMYRLFYNCETLIGIKITNYTSKNSFFESVKTKYNSSSRKKKKKLAKNTLEKARYKRTLIVSGCLLGGLSILMIKDLK